MSMSLTALSSTHAIGFLAFCVNKQFNIVPRTVRYNCDCILYTHLANVHSDHIVKRNEIILEGEGNYKSVCVFSCAHLQLNSGGSV